MVNNMKNLSRAFLMDIFNRMMLSLKIILRSKITMLVLFLSTISMVLILYLLNLGAQQRSNFPIGIVNLDTTKSLSGEFVEELKKEEALYVYEGDFEQLYQELLEGRIFSLYVIPEGFEHKIRTGKFKNLVTVYYGSESKTAALIKDIVAGDMMYSICLSRGARMYQGLFQGEASAGSREEYENYASLLRNSDQFDFSFDVEVLSKKEGNIEPGSLSNRILYHQMNAALFATLLSFVVLFAAAYLPVEKGSSTGKRLKLTLMNPVASYLGNLLAICIITSILCIFFVLLLCYYESNFTLFLPVMRLILVYLLIMGSGFLLLGSLTKNIFVYQLLGAFLTIGFGGVGMISVLGEVAAGIQTATFYVPNGWFVQKLAEIMVRH